MNKTRQKNAALAPSSTPDALPTVTAETPGIHLPTAQQYVTPPAFSDPDQFYEESGQVPPLQMRQDTSYYIEKYGRYFAVKSATKLICVCVYRKGARAVIEHLTAA
jgi:hypothetical protein